jgi:hypothetical protein
MHSALVRERQSRPVISAGYTAGQKPGRSARGGFDPGLVSAETANPGQPEVFLQ